MDPPVKLLPLELEEEILSRLPLSSLARFKTVCKKWKALFSDQSFLSRVRPQIICLTNSHQVYSIDIIDLHSTEPKILKRKIPSSNHIPDSDVFHTNITTCDEFLFCNSRFKNKRTAIWNLVMRQPKWIEYEVGVEAQFYVCGLGYDNTGPKKVYKMLGYFLPYYRVAKKQLRVYVYECASHALKYIYIPDDDLPFKEEETRTNVSLNGNLYWVTHNPTNYFIRSFDFSMEVFKTFCLLPFQKNHFRDELVLAVFKGDRFSLLNLSYLERKINIWVTKKKINDREQVVWINLMTLSPTDLPKLPRPYVCTRMSYYIYDNTLVMCCSSDETGQACIYIVKGDMCKKITMSSMYFQCCHCAYVPNVAFLT